MIAPCTLPSEIAGSFDAGLKLVFPNRSFPSLATARIRVLRYMIAWKPQPFNALVPIHVTGVHLLCCNCLHQHRKLVVQWTPGSVVFDISRMHYCLILRVPHYPQLLKPRTISLFTLK